VKYIPRIRIYNKILIRRIKVKRERGMFMGFGG